MDVAEETHGRQDLADHPEDWPPNECHSGIESQIPWDIIHHDLPRWRTGDDPGFVAARDAAGRPQG